MVDEILSRREQHRLDTTREIKDLALELLGTGGPGAVSLRAIAREMRMTPGALYSYFATRDDLVTAIIEDTYASLVLAVEDARDAAGGDPRDRVRAWAGAFRDWSVAHRHGFRLVYGEGVPGYVRPSDSAATAAEYRLCEGLIGLVAAVSVFPEEGSWAEYDDELVAYVRVQHPDAPPALIGRALRLWGRMHGLVALEVYGHLGPQVRDTARLHAAEVEALVDDL